MEANIELSSIIAASIDFYLLKHSCSCLDHTGPFVRYIYLYSNPSAEYGGILHFCGQSMTYVLDIIENLEHQVPYRRLLTDRDYDHDSLSPFLLGRPGKSCRLLMSRSHSSLNQVQIPSARFHGLVDTWVSCPKPVRNIRLCYRLQSGGLSMFKLSGRFIIEHHLGCTKGDFRAKSGFQALNGSSKRMSGWRVGNDEQYI